MSHNNRSHLDSSIRLLKEGFSSYSLGTQILPLNPGKANLYLLCAQYYPDNFW